jgi:hypothetical protein
MTRSNDILTEKISEAEQATLTTVAPTDRARVVHQFYESSVHLLGYRRLRAWGDFIASVIAEEIVSRSGHDDDP